jgi:hypothetical protein
VRRLKIVTTALFVFGLGTLLSYPITVGSAPKRGAELTVRKAYAIRLAVFFGAACASLLGAATGAMLIARRLRREFADRSLQNLADLLTAEVEGKPTESVND